METTMTTKSNPAGWPVSAAVLALGLAGCGSAPIQTPPISTEAAPAAQACPDTVPGDARCWFGQDSLGAHYVIVMTKAWNGTLMLHAHGGPTLGPVKPDRALADLKRWAVWVRGGYAFAASTYRQGGVEVRAAAEDTERLRRLFVQHVAKPRFTVLHGQSWGGNVAAKGAETFTKGRPYDAVLLTSGVLAGGSKAYDFRIDLRVVYQVLCGNHPSPQDGPYPVWMGLPADSTLTRAQLAARAKDCLGVGLKPAERSPEQAKKLATIARVIRIPEASVLVHLNWATFHFQDIVQHRTGGRNPFTTAGVRYTGSDDDAALNAAVARFSADPAARAHMVADTDMTGQVPVPVLTVHAIGDPTAFVEMEAAYAETMKAGGSGDRLVQVFADYDVHSYLADPIYLAAAEQLIAWGRGGAKPTPQTVADRCAAVAGPAAAECRIRPDYRPAPLSARVPAR